MNSMEIIKLIAESKKKTPVIVFFKGTINKEIPKDVKFFGCKDFGVLIGDYDLVKKALDDNNEKIDDFYIEVKARNSALPLADITKYNARIEPGAIIRDMVEIGDNAVIMMGAVVNIGAVIGEKTMIDMNAVIGGRVIIGKNCHIGAGAVIAGVIEPPSARPVIIEDDVMIGANAVVLEGVKVGKGAVVAAGAVVTEDVEPYTVVAGIPAKVIKKVDERTKKKTKIVEDLRNLGGKKG